jgi:hypothetical protein
MVAFNDVAGDTALRRQIILTANQFRKGVTAPSDVTIGSTPTIPAQQFAATNELVSLFQAMPFNWDKGDVDLVLIWSLAAVETNGDQLSTTLDYTAPIALSTGNGLAKTSTQLTNDLTVTTANGLAIGDVYSQTFTLSAADGDNPLANAIGIAIEIHLTNTVGVALVDLIGACISYAATH